MRKETLYIEADCADNSVVLSSGLCKALDIVSGSVVRIFVFRIKDSGEYAFKRVTPAFSKHTECPIVSYNPKYREYGFVSVLPTVNRIFYDLRLDVEKATLPVTKRKLPDGTMIYVIKP